MCVPHTGAGSRERPQRKVPGRVECTAVDAVAAAHGGIHAVYGLGILIRFVPHTS